TQTRYKGPMIQRFAISMLVLWSTVAAAQGLPKAGDALPLGRDASLPKLTWTYNAPSDSDAAGKVIIHWFCSPKGKGCADDLARLVTLRENGGVYIVAYIDGSMREAKKLDPIRE